jgi:hypothetical protein
MKTFCFKITISAQDQKEAIKKVQALTTVGSNLNEKELTKLADIIKNDPVQTALAKSALGF